MKKKKKENIAIIISVLTFILFLIQTFYFQVQTNQIIKQTSIQNKAFENYKKNSELASRLEKDKVKFENKKNASKLLIDLPKIINKNLAKNEPNKIIEFSAKNIGKNIISNYSEEHLFFVKLTLFSDTDKKIITHSSLYPVDFRRLERRGNDIIFFDKIKYKFTPEIENDILNVFSDMKVNCIYKSDIIVETIPENSNFTIATNFGLKYGEKLFTLQPSDYEILCVLKIKYTDQITLKTYEDYGFFHFDKKWNAHHIKQKRFVETLKEKYLIMSKNVNKNRTIRYTKNDD
jgi:hypothetical protein